MSISAIFEIGKSALLTSQTVLAVASHNIANMTTPGYNRQDVVLDINNPIGSGSSFIGTGVNVRSIRRQYDSFIQNQLYLGEQNFGYASSRNSSLSQIEQVYNEVNNIGLATPMKEFFNAWQDLASNPEGSVQRNILLQKSSSLIISAQRMERTQLDTVRNTNDQISDVVSKINGIAEGIARFNYNISQLEGGPNGEKVNDMRDQRDQLLKELSELTDFEKFENSANGSISVMVGMTTLVSEGNTYKMTIAKDFNADYNISIGTVDVTDRIAKGNLGGLIEVRDDIKDIIRNLRKLVGSVINELNIQHSSGYGLNANAASAFTITDKTPTGTTTGVINAGTTGITDFTNFQPGDYKIVNTGVGAYSVYRNGSTTPVANVTGTASSVTFNGTTVNFSTNPAVNDTFYLSAKQGNFFNDLTLFTRNETSSAASVTSSSIFDRSALAYDEYEIEFTDATNYAIYRNGESTAFQTGAYTSGGHIQFEGIDVVITGTGATAPKQGDAFSVSPIKEAISLFTTAITDIKQIAASGTSTGLPGDNSNALAIVALSQGEIPELDNTFDDYYRELVATVGSMTRDSNDSVEFETNFMAELNTKRDSLSGVSLDEEAANLIKFQRSYEAGAKLLTMADEMLQTVMNIRR